MNRAIFGAVGLIAALMGIFGVPGLIPGLIHLFQPRIDQIVFCSAKSCPERLELDQAILSGALKGVIVARSIVFTEPTSLAEDTMLVANNIDFGGFNHTGVRTITILARGVRNGSIDIRGADPLDGGAAVIVAGTAEGLTVNASGRDGLAGGPGRRGGAGRDGRCDGFGKWKAGQAGSKGGKGEDGGHGGDGGKILVLSPLPAALDQNKFAVGAGRGGLGGPGGAGGDGGRGCTGLGGSQPNKAQGQAGPPGDVGSNGDTGSRRLSAVNLGRLIKFSREGAVWPSASPQEISERIRTLADDKK